MNLNKSTKRLKARLTVSQCRQLIITSLKNLPHVNAEQESIDILMWTLHHDQVWVTSNSEASVSPLQHRRIQAIIAQRQQGDPLAYILGSIRYGDFELKVNRHCLIPRPETEQLITTAQQIISTQPHRIWRIADIGTGTGVIAIGLAQYCQAHSINCHIDATDISRRALRIARANIYKYKLSPLISISKQNLLDNNRHPYALIVANLPYVPTGNTIGLKDPLLALDGGTGGLDLIRMLLNQIHSAKLQTDILLEIGDNQAEAISSYAHQLWPRAKIKADNDLAGFNRVIHISIQ